VINVPDVGVRSGEPAAPSATPVPSVAASQAASMHPTGTPVPSQTAAPSQIAVLEGTLPPEP